MKTIIEILKAVLFGIVEGVTEWLPVSSTGHMILLDEFIKLQVSEAFYEMFQVVIQLGAILAVVLLFWKKLDPVGAVQAAWITGKNRLKHQNAPIPQEKSTVLSLWLKVIVAVIPSAVLGLLLDDWMDEHLYNYVVVAIALITYGVAFLLVESRNRGRKRKVKDVYAIDYRTALLIGAFQCLSLIPGTSRSGSTILGAILLGVGRSAGAEFSFFLAIPTMLGASLLKIVKFLGSGVSATGTEIAVLIVGCVVSFAVSVVVIRGLMDYVRKHNFSVFGLYRIGLGVLVLIYFLIKSLI